MVNALSFIPSWNINVAAISCYVTWIRLLRKNLTSLVFICDVVRGSKKANPTSFPGSLVDNDNGDPGNEVEC